MKRTSVVFILLLLSMTFTQVLRAQFNNYIYAPTTGAWNSIIGQGGTTLLFDPAIDATNDDDYYTGVPIGFTFSYLGSNYTDLSCCANGFALLGGTSVSGNSWTPDLDGGSGSSGRPLLAPFWSDMELLEGTGGSSLGYRTDGSSPNRVFTLEWNKVEWTYTTGVQSISFQIKLYEASGAVEFLYNQEADQSSTQNLAIGITAAGTGAGSFLNCTDATLASVSSTTEVLLTTRPASNTRLLFTPVTGTISAPTSFSTSNVQSSSMTIGWTNNAATAYAAVVYISVDATNYSPKGIVSMTGTGNYSLNVTGLSGNTTYYYRIYAAGNSGTSNPLSGSQATAAGSLFGTRQIPTSSYPTIKSAIDSLNTFGLAGPIVFELLSSYTSSSETYPLTFSGISGSSATNTVTFRPSASATGLSISGSNATTLIDFNGVKNVKFDGRPGGTGSTSQLTISNTNTSATAGTIRFINDATADVIRYCTILGSSTSTSAGTVTFSTPASVGCSNDTLANCVIGPTSTSLLPARAVYASGSTTVIGVNNTIDNCSIYDYFIASTTNYGIGSIQGYTKWTISNNSFYQTATRSHTAANTIYNIYISASYNPTGNRIIGNSIGGTSAGAGGSAMTHALSTSTLSPIFYGIYCSNNSSTTDTTTISGNVIANINFTSASTGVAFYGINALYGNMFVSNNVIGAGTGTGSISITNNATATGFTVNGIVAQPSSVGALISMTGNTVGSINMTTTTPASSGCSFLGISLSGAIGANSTVSNNTVGSSSTANSINAQTAVTGTATQGMTGIQVASSSGNYSTTVSSNIVANIINNGTSATSAANYVRGIYASSGVVAITGNTVRNLYNAAGNASGTTTTMSVVGIVQGSSTTPLYPLTGQLVSGNTIHTLSNTNTSAASMFITGITMTSSSAGGISIVEKNFIHSIFNASSSNTNVLAFAAAGGQTVYRNNMIRLGFDNTGSAVTNPNGFQGFQKITTTKGFFDNNTVYIGGTNVTGTSNTFCFWRNSAASAGVDEIRNNIFQNARSNSSGTGAHICILLGSSTSASAAVACSALSLNNNLYYHAGTGGYIGGILYTPGSTIYIYSTIPSWSGACSQDNASGYSSPGLVFPTGTSANVNVHITGNTAARGGGVGLAAVSDDFDGDSRPGANTDIGADQCSSCSANDIFPPTISYTSLSNGIVESARTINNITITDYSGVNTTSGTRPRIYYKKSTDADQYSGNTSTDNGWKWVESSSTSSPYTFVMNYGLLQSAVALGDVIQYFVIAQDVVATPNVGVNTNTFTSFPTSVNIANGSFPSANYRSFTIMNGVSGTVNVGTSETITSLTNTGGLFEYINNRVVTGNITALITSDLTSEGGTVALNETIEYGNGGYTITIRPAASLTPTVSGSFAGGLIRLNGADRVIIDGRRPGDATGNNLNITNTATSGTIATIQVSSLGTGLGAVNDTIRYCNIRTGLNTNTTAHAIYVGSQTIATAGDDNDNLAITNNRILATYYGIRIAASGSAHDNTLIQNNIFGLDPGSSVTTDTVRFNCIDVTFANNLTVDGNLLQNISNSTSTAISAMNFTNCSIGTVSANVLSRIINVASTATAPPVRAIGINSGVNNFRITRNQIDSIKNNQTGSGYGCVGIDITTGLATSVVTVDNNMISNIISDGDASIQYGIYGIRVGYNTATGGVRILNNSVLMRGTTLQIPTTSSWSPTSAALCIASGSTTIDVRNNIFVNNLIHNPANNNRGNGWTVYSVVGSSAFTNFDYNILRNGTNTTGGFALFNNTAQASFAAFQAATAANTNSFLASPNFVDSANTDLHLNAIYTNFLGTPSVSSIITNDFDNKTRTNYYIGADEVTPVLSFTQNPSTSTLCVGQAMNLTVTVNSPIPFDDAVTRNNPNITYQWYKGTSPIAGATTSSYSISSVTTGDAGSYFCRIWVSNLDSATSSTGVITVNTLPAITADPQSVNRCLGTALVLGGSATGTAITYQWQKLVGSTWTNIAGATNSTFTIASLTASDFASYRFVASGACSPAATSAVAVVTQLNPTVINSQPTATPSSLCLGQNFTLSVSAAASNIGYQWKRNGGSIAGATNATLTITNAQAADFATYSVVISGDCGILTSNNVIVTQIAPTVISAQPSTSTPQICLGQPFTITMSASGASLTYQWRKNGTNISGATTNTYSVLAAVASDFGNYDVVVNGTCGSLTSSIQSIVQIPATQITTQPIASTVLCAGATFNPSVVANGANVTYQWQKLSGSTWNNIIGAVNPALIISNVAVSDSGSYRVIVTGTCGALTSTTSVLSVNSPISITAQPAWTSSNACTGETTTLSMTATGTITTYQWQKFDGSVWQNIVGATSNSYTIASVVLSDAGSYRIQISGPCSATLTSNQAVLSVQQNVQVSAQPQPQTACVGASISFSVSTVGTVVGYQWEQDRLQNGSWAPISGATNATYSKSNVSLLDSGLYRVKVTGNCSAIPVISGTALATIQSIFNITTQPTWPSTPVNVGQTVTLNVGFTGTANFQWQRDQQRNGSWVNVGANSPQYSFVVNTVADSGNYRCVVSGPCGAVTQNTNVVAVFTCQPPVVTQQPQTPTPVCIGGSLTLGVAVNTQGQTVSYQWQIDQARNGTWVAIGGATSAVYTKNNVQISDDGNYRVQVISACSSVPVFSNAVSFVVLSSNNILSNPVSQTVCAGVNVTMSVTVGGTSPSYQWYYNGAPIQIGQNSTAQTANLVLTNVTPGSAGNYSCFVTGPCTPNGVFSNSATLTVNSPVILLQPQSQTGCVGSSLSFTSQASGTGISYQWQKNQSNISGATNATYTIASPVVGDAGQYRVVATNTCGSVTSNSATLTMTVPASVAVQPQSQAICRGTNLTVSVGINVDATSPSYQWQRNGVNLSTSTYSTAKSATLVVPNIQPSEAGAYTCLIVTPCQPLGVTTNVAQITVNPSTAINTQPTGATICEGVPYTFSVGAVGTTLSYQWLKDGTPIVGATNANLVLNSPVASDAGSYTVVVNGSCTPTSLTSTSATLVVNTNPRITSGTLAPLNVCQGNLAIFSITATGTGLSYQWRFNGVPIVGNASALTATLQIPNITTANAGNYDCVVSGTCVPGGVATNQATLVVNTPIVITQNPVFQVACTLNKVSFSVANTGTGASYQWRRNGFNITNNATATSSTLVLPSVGAADAGLYDCVVSGTCNTAFSSIAQLVVQTGLSITTQPDAQRVCAGTTLSATVAASGTVIGYQWQKDGVNIAGQTNATLVIANAQVAQSGGYRCVITGSTACGTAQQVSNTVEMLVGTSPIVTKQPANTPVSVGSTVSVQVDASGLGYGVNNVMQYAWFKGSTRLTDGAHYSGTNTNVLTIRGVIPSDVGTDYFVSVTGVCGTAISNQFSLYVPTVNITGQPQAATLCTGEQTIFTVVAVPSQPSSTLNYQWFKGTTPLVDGANISGATTSTLTLTGATSGDAGDYSCEVTVQPGGSRVTSSVATLTVNSKPAISSQPADTTVCVGSALRLSVASTGGSLSYQWSHNGTVVNGATSAQLTIPSISANDAGAYVVVVRNACGTATSSAASVTLTNPPTITTQPVSQTVGVNAVFTVSTVATGSGTLSYQWTINGIPIPGATQASYTRTGTTKSDEGSYACVVSNPCGNVTTGVAVISISTVGVSDAEIYGYSISNPQPNPTADVASIHIVLPEANTVLVDVSDAGGRVVATLVNAELEAGEHVLVLNAVGNNLASGTYYIRLLTADGLSTTRRIVIVR